MCTVRQAPRYVRSMPSGRPADGSARLRPVWGPAARSTSKHAECLTFVRQMPPAARWGGGSSSRPAVVRIVRLNGAAPARAQRARRSPAGQPTSRPASGPYRAQPDGGYGHRQAPRRPRRPRRACRRPPRSVRRTAVPHLGARRRERAECLTVVRHLDGLRAGRRPAQWGRAREGAGGRIVFPVGTMSTSLQWGRAREGAGGLPHGSGPA